ncbi:MAG: Ig-like domain-containing protein [Clostridia bacterium]|nr:Ig-like domain-containing protein [Clostridia bacterium]
MKKILAILLCVFMVVGLLAACGDGGETTSSKPANSTTASIDNAGTASVEIVENDDGTIDLEVTYAEIGAASEKKTPSIPEGKKHVQSISVKDEVIYLEIGKVVKIEPTILPADAADPSIYWSSENEGVAKVDKDGQVLGVEAGSTEIVLETNDRHFKAKVTVIVYRAGTDAEKTAAMIAKINAARKEAGLAELDASTKEGKILTAAATERAFEEAAEGDKKMDDERPTKNADGSAKTNAQLLGINGDYALWYNAKACLYSWKNDADVDAMYNTFMENENNKAQLLADGTYQYIGVGVFEHKGISYWCILLMK